MKKIVLGLVVVACSVLLNACNGFLTNDLEETMKLNEQQMLNYINTKNLQMTKADNGMYYQITQTNASGKKVNLGDEVKLHFVLSLLDGTRIDSTERLKNAPFSGIFGGTIGLQGLLDAINTLREGERGLFLIPSYLAFGSQTQNKIPANSVVVFDLEAVRYRSEDQQIEEYIATGTNTTFVSTDTTASGVKVLKITETTGTQLAAGQTATVKYTGYLASTIKQFDTGQIDVYLGGGGVVKGFDEGLQKLRVGEKAVLVFKSALGYGTQGIADQTTNTYKIPPYSPLIFVVEVKSTK
ncbi:FKBP-type peptidyl-prolyl cis-trans isomerase [Emticicia sp. BO119]|uniref:FKBP-type peptidyl-prolyl cis-trans isomerase n=1 Tax=Emticicia sp. BO119 TaxID=2757768 RepID=UPI0015F1226E|nr:FKBP-type peptidyl-prolyl cis-trans isomerase [Emticicia sp. BO119]MBA4851885.1 FKBP-type peptidyl-prolyl cis-trans isomerase [Emticicia sp. BO119]